MGSHVDDLLVIGPKDVKRAICEALSVAFPVDSWEEGAFSYVGTEIGYDENGVYLNQQSYIENRLFKVAIPGRSRGRRPRGPRDPGRQQEPHRGSVLGVGAKPTRHNMCRVDVPAAPEGADLRRT